VEVVEDAPAPPVPAVVKEEGEEEVRRGSSGSRL